MLRCVKSSERKRLLCLYPHREIKKSFRNDEPIYDVREYEALQHGLFHHCYTYNEKVIRGNIVGFLRLRRKRVNCRPPRWSLHKRVCPVLSRLPAYAPHQSMETRKKPRVPSTEASGETCSGLPRISRSKTVSRRWRSFREWVFAIITRNLDTN